MSETVPTWLAEVSEAVTEATNIAKVQGLVESLTEARKAFAAHLVEFHRFVIADTLGRGNWWGGYGPDPELANELRQASKDPQPRVVNSLIRRLDTHRASISRELISDWNSHAGKRMGNVADLQQLAVTLGDVDGVADLAAKFEEVLGKLIRAQSQVPTQESLTLLDHAEQHLAALESALRPEDVRTFLSAVARGGAALDLLTEDVLIWLRRHGAPRKFRIVAGAPAENS
jgi:hypothetical protein